MNQQYRLVFGDTSGEKRDCFYSWVGTETKLYSDGEGLMANSDINSIVPYALALTLIRSPKRVIYLGNMSLSLTKGEEDDRYYELVRKNISKEVAMPTYKEVWESHTISPLSLDVLFKWQDSYLVNEDKKQYISMKKYMKNGLYQKGMKMHLLNPLLLLTAVGNDMGDGDYVEYYGTHMELIGAWAWNLLRVRLYKPKGYTEITDVFKEYETLEDTRL